MIKTKLIKTDKAEILVLGGLPEDAVIGIIAHGGMIYRTPDASGYDVNRHVVDLLRGKWDQLGFFDNITDDVAKGLVDKVTMGYYLDYLNPKSRNDYMKATATESLHSLVEANCKLENKYGEYPTKENTGLEYGMQYIGIVEEWEEEQEKVFTHPFILKKID